MRHLLLIVLSYFIFTPLVFAQTLVDARKQYAKKNYKRTEKILKKVVKEDPKNLDNRQFVVNYCYWENKIADSKKQANKGYLLSPDGSDYQYFFYNKLINNKIMGEASFTSGSKYDKRSYYMEYQHNYDQKNWFILSYQTEDRLSPFNQFGDLLGLGFITFLDKDLMLYSNFQIPLRKSFFPNFIVDNEIFKFDGNNTYSFDFKLSFYDQTSIVSFSPHYRHDWDQFYAGGRPYLLFANNESLLYWLAYGGYVYNYKHSGEIGYSFGENEDDGVTPRDFTSYYLKYKYNLSHRAELSLKYNHLENYGDRVEDTYFINLLWKY